MSMAASRTLPVLPRLSAMKRSRRPLSASTGTTERLARGSRTNTTVRPSPSRAYDATTTRSPASSSVRAVTPDTVALRTPAYSAAAGPHADMADHSSSNSPQTWW